MQILNQTKTLPYSAQDLFDLVLDIDAYQEFLPWCKASKIISEDNRGIMANLIICYKGISQTYNSKITTNISNGTYEINVEGIPGPFKSLYNNWKFHERTDGSLLEVNISLELKNTLLDKLIGTVFQNITAQMIESFERRASEKLIRIKSK